MCGHHLVISKDVKLLSKSLKRIMNHHISQRCDAWTKLRG